MWCAAVSNADPTGSLAPTPVPGWASMNAIRSDLRNRRSRRCPIRRHRSLPELVQRRSEVSLTLRKRAACSISKRSSLSTALPSSHKGTTIDQQSISKHTKDQQSQRLIGYRVMTRNLRVLILAETGAETDFIRPLATMDGDVKVRRVESSGA